MHHNADKACVISFARVALKARCYTRFQRAFTSCCCVFKEITFIGPKQRNVFENANTCSKRTLKTRVTTRLQRLNYIPLEFVLSTHFQSTIADVTFVSLLLFAALPLRLFT